MNEIAGLKYRATGYYLMNLAQTDVIMHPSSIGVMVYSRRYELWCHRRMNEQCSTNLPKSLYQHAVPPWFHNAKLGIFIHWGLFSVPGWASVAHNLHEMMENGDWETWFRNNAYAEWYANTIKLEGCPAQEYHQETFGDMPYTGFAPMFNEAITAWNPDAWARTFKRVGAQYVVLVTKHHDGFLLWPSEHPNPF